MTDEKRLSYLEEYMSSPLSSYKFEKEKGLSYKTISYWIRKFGIEDKSIPTDMNKELKPTEKELQKKIRELEQQVKRLKVELKHSNMARDAYDCMIDLAEETYNIKVRKNSDAR